MEIRCHQVRTIKLEIRCHQVRTISCPTFVGHFYIWSNLLKLEFFTVNDTYIQFLKKIDSKTPNNYAMGKPFVGVLFSIGEINYIAPLTSAKDKHKSIKNSNPAAFKIYDESDTSVEPKLISVVQLNNMIPVNNIVINKFDISIYDSKYQSLINKEINYIRTHSTLLINKANTLYDIVINKKVPALVNISCNFKDLEHGLSSYIPPA